VHVAEDWVERVGPRSPEEEDQLDFAFDVRPSSRLACQIKVTDELDGLVVHTPAYQGR
jgi:2Fe-2S ferredoxin